MASVVACWDFPTLSFRHGNVKSHPLGTGRPGFSGRICSFWPGFPAVAFLAWGILKNSMGGRQIVLVLTAGFSVLNFLAGS